jgi:hypothetical protein
LLERRNFRIFLNYHWWDLINTNLHRVPNIVHWLAWFQIVLLLEILEMQLFWHITNDISPKKKDWQWVAKHQSINVIIGCYGLAAGVQLTPLKSPQHLPSFLEMQWHNWSQPFPIQLICAHLSTMIGVVDLCITPQPWHSLVFTSARQIRAYAGNARN